MAATPEQWSLQDLRLHLQAAVELELLVIPPYLSALYSLRPGFNRVAELILRSVVVEEMLHLTLAANVLNAVGGHPRVNDPTWTPRYPTQLPFHKGRFEVSLQPFGRPALETFLTIENPSYKPAQPTPPPPGAAVPRLLTLAAGDREGYETVGAFYKAIEAGLCAIVALRGEEEVFTGDPSLQVRPEHYYGAGGEVVEVRSLQTAREALEQIVEQGEGELTLPLSGEKFDPSRDLAHFYRFNELHAGRRYLAEDTPDRPTGDAIELNLVAVYPLKVNLRLSEIPPGEVRRAATDCAVMWTRLLDQVQSGISGEQEALREAVASMFELKYAAQQLLRVPLPGEKASHAGPTFEYMPSETGRKKMSEPGSAASARPLPPIAEQGDDVPFYYASLVVVEVLYLVDAAVAAGYLAGSGLDLARFEGGRGAAGFNFQMYTSHFPNSMGRIIELEMNILGLPSGRPAPQVGFRDWVLGQDQSRLIGNHRVHVPCDDPIAIAAGERKFGEPKFLTQFLQDVPSVNGPATGTWRFTCCDPEHPPGPKREEGEARTHAIFSCEAQTAGLQTELSYPSPITEYGTVTAAGPEQGKLIGARWNVFGPWQTWFLDSGESGRVSLTYGKSSHPMQSDLKKLIADALPAVVRAYSYTPCSVQPRTFWP